jgi:hypothetical protein
MSITERFVSDMTAINSWAKSCKTKAHLITVINFFDEKRKRIQPECDYMNRDNLLSIGEQIGRVMQTLELKVETLKKEQEKLAQ